MAVVGVLARQRRFKQLLVGLLVLAVVLGLIIVPVEQRAQDALITTYYDGLYWATTTITSVGYGDFYPVTDIGKFIGTVLEVTGVLAFGLMISMVTLALSDPKDRFYWHRAYERLDRIEQKLDRAGKHDKYMVELQGHERKHERKPK